MPAPARPKRRSGDFGGGGRKFTPRRKVCAFCVDKIDEVDYKDVARLRRFLSDRAKIEPRRKTGTCAKHQRSLNVALKRARHLALLPFTAEHIRVTGMLLREPSAPRGPRPFRPVEGAPEPAQAPAAETPAAEAPAPEAPAETPSPDGAAESPEAVAEPAEARETAEVPAPAGPGS